MAKLTDVKGIGKNLAKTLIDLGIRTPYQLVKTFPKGYEELDLTNFLEAKNGDTVTVIGDVLSLVTFQKRVHLTKMNVKIDNKFQTTALAFNRKYLKNQLKIGDKILIKGKYDSRKNEIVANIVSKNLKRDDLEPKYNLEGINNYQMSQAIKGALEIVPIYETLPYWILREYKLLSEKNAVRMIHFPENYYEFNQAQRKFKYTEAITIQLGILDKTLKKTPRDKIDYNLEEVQKVIDSLAYELTNDQKQAVNDIFIDFNKKYETKRLIQGDVGSGKTIVAILGGLGMITAGKQVVFMVPTEILARQQYETVKNILKDYNVSLLTSKLKVSEKRQIYQDLEAGKIDFLIGTHAVASEKVDYHDLGLVIIDEQHKFGVNIRKTLINKGKETDVLYLTATPIPRTLGIALFSELETSIIKEKPSFQKEVKTVFKSYEDLDDILYESLENIKKGEHTFVVVPAIESELKEATILEYKPILKKWFKDDLYVLHGKLSQNEKEEVTESFLSSKGGVLLATSMVEVGIDVKTATTMIILGANNFGLSQLHQLRGRIGRGNLDATCYVISEDLEDERLKLLETISDGFKLSEYDLKTRGPGDFLGVKQSGLLESDYLDFAEDYQILLDAKKIAIKLLNDPEFKDKKENYFLINSIKSD